jgi:hypothetical protein
VQQNVKSVFVSASPNLALKGTVPCGRVLVLQAAARSLRQVARRRLVLECPPVSKNAPASFDKLARFARFGPVNRPSPETDLFDPGYSYCRAISCAYRSALPFRQGRVCVAVPEPMPVQWSSPRSVELRC